MVTGDKDGNNNDDDTLVTVSYKTDEDSGERESG